MIDPSLISVILPVYNVAEYLDKTMETVTRQTYSNLEIILVDDGSKDNSGSMCERWATADPRIRVIHQENKGLSGARNTGIEAATGTYIMFADSDDLLSPDLCQTLYDALDADVDIAICDFAHVYPGQTPQFHISSETEHLSATAAINRMWYQKDFLPSACAKLYHRSLFDEIRFTVGRLFEDVDIMHEIFCRAEHIAYNHSTLYGYIHRENSITTKHFGVRDLDILLIAQKILVFSEGMPAVRKAAEAYAVTAALRVYLNAPKEEAFRQGLLQAKQLLKQYGKSVLGDPNIRKKNRYALLLYFCCKPLIHPIYQLIDRWK